MEYILENFGYICCFDEVSALDGETIDVFKNSSFTCGGQCYPELSPIELQLEFQSTRPSTYCIPDAKRGYYGFIIIVVRVRRDFLLVTYSPHFFLDFFHIWQVA